MENGDFFIRALFDNETVNDEILKAHNSSSPETNEHGLKWNSPRLLRRWNFSSLRNRFNCSVKVEQSLLKIFRFDFSRLLFFYITKLLWSTKLNLDPLWNFDIEWLESVKQFHNFQNVRSKLMDFVIELKWSMYRIFYKARCDSCMWFNQIDRHKNLKNSVKVGFFSFSKFSHDKCKQIFLNIYTTLTFELHFSHLL